MKTHRSCWCFSSGYSTASPGVEEWRDLRRVMKSGEHSKNLLRLSGEFGAAFSPLPLSFLAQGTCPSAEEFVLFTLGP